MKQFFSILALVITLGLSMPARADIWGGDVAVLVQILANAVQQLTQLRQILGAGEQNLELIRQINRGINDSLNLMNTIGPNRDPGLYKDWNSVQAALEKVQQIYGIVVESKEAIAERDTDQTVAEAVTLNNAIYKYTDQLDSLGEQIKASSHTVSPGGAQKLTAQTLGVMLNVMNQSLRTQATGLKLQAQAMAVANKHEKEQSQHLVEATNSLQAMMQNHKTQFEFPRF